MKSIQRPVTALGQCIVIRTYHLENLSGYFGDETVVTQFPHSNSKWKAKLTTPYVRTNPDLFDEIRKKNGAPSTIFRKQPTELTLHLVDAPRDIEQFSNIKKKLKKK